MAVYRNRVHLQIRTDVLDLFTNTTISLMIACKAYDGFAAGNG